MGEEEAKETSTTGGAEREGRRLVTARCNSLPVQCPIGVTGHCELRDSPGLGSINQGVPCEAIQLGSRGVAQGSELCHLFLLNSPELLCHTSESSSVSGVGEIGHVHRTGVCVHGEHQGTRCYLLNRS